MNLGGRKAPKPLSILETRKSDIKDGRRQGRQRQRDEFRSEQAISLPFPLPLIKESNHIVWPLIQHGKQPYFIGKVNCEDCCVDIYDSASVQCLYLMGFFGKGSHSRNAPIYKMKRKTNADFDRNRQQTNFKGRKNKKKNKKKTNLEPNQRHRAGQDGKRQFGNCSSVDKEKKQQDSLHKAFPYLADKKVLIAQLHKESIYDGEQVDRMDGRLQEAATGVDQPKPMDWESDSDVSYCGFTSAYDSDSSAVSESSATGTKQEMLKLGLEEAFFLSYGLGILNVKSADGTKDLSINEMWSLYRTMFNDEDSFQFPILYAAYHFFRSHGWVVKSGLKFGCELMLYKEGPPFYHALLSMSIIKQRECEVGLKSSNCEPELTWQYLTGYHRLSQGVVKQPVCCYVIVPIKLEDKDFDDGPSVIEQLTIRTVLIERWMPGAEMNSKPVGDDASD